jgi:DHA2 family multidrug resistance protein
MMGNLGATLDEIDWVITSYMVANVIVIPLTGWMSRRFGRKRYFVSSICVFTASSLLCGASQTVEQLIFWRLVQGLGGGRSSRPRTRSSSRPSRRRSRASGQALFGMGAMVGPSLGPTLGGFLTDNYSWHWCFLINVPLGIAAAILCAAHLHDPPHAQRRPGGRIDWPGVVLLVVGVGAFQTVLERGNKYDWFESPMIALLAVVAAVGIVGLLIREFTTDEPIIDFRVLKHKQLALACGLGSLTTFGLFGLIFLFPLYTQTLLGWTAWQSGLAVLPSSIATAVMMGFMGRLVWHVGPRPIFLAGMVMMPLTLWRMSQWSLASGWDDLFWAQMMRGHHDGDAVHPALHRGAALARGSRRGQGRRHVQPVPPARRQLRDRGARDAPRSPHRHASRRARGSRRTLRHAHGAASRRARAALHRRRTRSERRGVRRTRRGEPDGRGVELDAGVLRRLLPDRRAVPALSSVRVHGCAPCPGQVHPDRVVDVDRVRVIRARAPRGGR